LQFLDAFDGVDRFLNRLGNLRLDLSGRRARQPRTHAHDRQIDRGEAIDAQFEVTRDPHDHERQHDHRCEDRSSDANVSELLHELCSMSPRQ
jgi:hypothetical protein